MEWFTFWQMRAVTYSYYPIALAKMFCAIVSCLMRRGRNFEIIYSSAFLSLNGNYGKKKKQTVTSFAYESCENSPSVLKFLLELLFGIIKHHWKNRWPALNSLGIIDFLKALVRWSEIQSTHIRIFKEWINKLKKNALNLVRFWWNLKWK